MLTKAEFAQQIRQALENLHDFVFLQNLPLTHALKMPNHPLDRSVRQLRSILIDAIEQLDPPDELPPRARERRPYQILYGRYVQGMSTNELVEELAISVRQLRRENRRALAAVTELLWERLAPQLATSPPAPQFYDVNPRREAARLETEHLIAQAHAEILDLQKLVTSLFNVLVPIAARRTAQLISHIPDSLPPIYASRIILRQGLMEIFSFGIDCAAGGRVLVEGKEERGAICLTITAQGKGRPQHRTGVSLDVSRRLLESLGGHIAIHDESHRWQAVVTLPSAPELNILVMDDNAGLVELFRRYLIGHPYRLWVAHTVEEALQRSQEIQLALILLDVMMPEEDGWEILQRLRTAPECQEIPIVVCSVLHEPEIAYTLGASDYLPKPVTQDMLLTMVGRWCNAPWAQEAQQRATPVDSSTSRLV